MSALSAERDLYVEKTAGDAGERVRARVNPNSQNLLRMTIDDARGRVVVTWDGADGLSGPGQVDFDGLGSIDFSNELSLDMIITFSDVGGPVSFRLWDANDLTGNTFAETTFNIPGMIPAGSSVLLSKNFHPLDFSATGAALADILDSVGAIQMTIDATAVAQEGWDMHMDVVRTTARPPVGPVPEPAPVALMTLGLLAAGIVRRRQRG